MFTAALAILKALDPRIWLGLAIAIAFAAFVGWVYHAGWSSARKEHLAYVEKQQAISAELLRAQRERKAQSDQATAELDKKRGEQLAAVGRAWAGWLRERPSGGAAAQPVRIDAAICDDPAKDNRLSDAVQRYVDGVRSAAEELGRGAATLLEQAERQAVDQGLCVEGWARLKKINSAQP